MKLTISEFRDVVRSLLSESDDKPTKPVDYRKKIGKIVKYLDRPFRVRDIFSRPTPYGTQEVFYVGTFDDEESSQTHYAPVEKTGRAPPNRAKKPEDFDDRGFVEQDVEHFLKAPNIDDNRPNIFHVRERWSEISKELSWMEKYIFEHKWLNTPMAKTNEQISVELDAKLPVIRAAESRAFRKIERIVTRNDEMKHDLDIIKQARAMHKAEMPIARIIVFLQSELKNKDWMNQLDFLR